MAGRAVRLRPATEGRPVRDGLQGFGDGNGGGAAAADAGGAGGRRGRPGPRLAPRAAQSQHPAGGGDWPERAAAGKCASAGATALQGEVHWPRG